MLETLLFPPLLHCAHCQADLYECPDKEFGDWIVRCLDCGAKNVIEIVRVSNPIADLEVIGWHE